MQVIHLAGHRLIKITKSLYPSDDDTENVASERSIPDQPKQGLV